MSHGLRTVVSMRSNPHPAHADGPLAGLAFADDAVAGRLDEVAGLLDDRDRTMGRAVRLLVALQHDDALPERLGGMTLQVWLEHHGRMTGADARALLGAVDVLARMPALVGGLCDRWVSWTQVLAICRAARTVPVGRLAELDDLVGGAMADLSVFEPDALVADVWQWVDALQPSRLEREERARDHGEFLTLAPRLFGGGSIYGEFGTVGFATVAEALDAPLGPPPAPEDLDDPDAVEAACDSLDEQRRALTRQHGQRLAGRLVELCEASLVGRTDDGTAVPPRPLLLATIDIDSLLDRTRTPGWVLHTLAGGRMQVSSRTLQRLVDERGADLTGIVLDDCGEVVGVGRTSHMPRKWMRRAIWARDVAVRDPDGSTPIRRADLDHVAEWPDGATDVSNLQPLGRRWHNVKTSGAWTVRRRRDGTTEWRHRRHGWLLRLAPPRRSLARPPDAGPLRLPLEAAVP